MNEPWKIQLFGALQVRQEERLITRFRTRQTGSLLAYLAFYLHKSHNRETLINIFWPESETETGRHNLSNALSSLRSQLEPPSIPSGAVIIADRFTVKLNPSAITTDVAEFEQALCCATSARAAPKYTQLLAEAVEKYNGSLLPHYYEDWIVPEQERLQRRFEQTISQLIILLEKSGDLERALDFALRALSANPLREESHRDVMRLLAALGQPEDALRRYSELECLLSKELGETPSSSARQLARRIEAQVIPFQSISLSVPVPPLTRIAMPASPLPIGTVTFLLTDIEGSSLPREKNCEAFLCALKTHHSLMQAEFRRNGGIEVKEADDSLLAAFAGASDALRCAIACRKAMEKQPWPEGAGNLKVRMALHTGDVEMEEGEYHGPMLRLLSQIHSTCNWDQILVSEATSCLLRRDLEPGASLKDLGVWKLRDTKRPERLFQLESTQFANLEFPTLNAEPALTTRLPLQFTRFFGRTEEIALIAERLQSSETRLLTLTGPGGTGKTRLAIEAVNKVAETFQGGIWFVPLADISDPGLIAGEIVDALSILLIEQGEALEQAVAALAKQPSLLILDNFEQLAEGGAEIVQTLMKRLPAMKCIVTSRRLLGLPGEQEFTVPPLSTPNGTDSPERLGQFESVRLFVDRAQASRPDFRITNSNAKYIAELCHKMEGIPLAIELAAARASALTPAQMLQQMDRRFEFLVSRKRGVAERQKTLKATLDWSYKLLSPELQRFFVQLSVFRGGWTAEAAEAVCEEPLAQDYLALLRECSLILTEDNVGGMRFRMLETLREYGETTLSLADRSSVLQRHAEFYISLVADVSHRGRLGEGFQWLDKEHENFRTVIAWCWKEPERFEMGARLVLSLCRFRVELGYWLECSRDTEQALEKSSQMAREIQAALFGQIGYLARRLRDYRRALEFYEKSVAMGDDSFFRMADIAETKRHIHGFSSAVRAEFESILCCFENFDSNGTAWTLEHMGYGAYSLGELDEAQRYYEWSLHTEFPFREERDSANVLFGLAQLALAREDMAEAIALSSRSLGIYQRSGNVAMKIWPLIVLGYAALHQQDYQTAHTHFFECLKISQRTNDPKACEVGLEAQAALMGAQEHGARASRLLGAAAALREKKQLRQDVPDRMRTESLLTAQRATLGESTFAAAWEAGRAMTGEEAVAYALES